MIYGQNRFKAYREKKINRYRAKLYEYNIIKYEQSAVPRFDTCTKVNRFFFFKNYVVEQYRYYNTYINNM